MESTNFKSIIFYIERMSIVISVAMASYNGEKYIEQQLDSIYKQSLKVDEIVIVDDQSKDNTLQVVKAYMENHPDCNIRLYENEVNLGYKKNFHKAISLCEGDYTFLCDQDDLWVEEKVESMMKIMMENPQIMVLASSFKKIDSNNQPIEVTLVKNHSNNNLYWKSVKENDIVQITFDEFIIQNFFQGCAMVMNSKIKQEFLENFTDELFHDWYINLLASKYGGMYFYNRPLFLYRIHDNNTIGLQESTNYKGLARLKKTSTLENRIFFARGMVHTLDVIIEHDKNLLSCQKDVKDKRDYFAQFIENIQDAHLVRLVKQNFSPYMRIMRTKKARVMDILFVLNRKFNKS